MLPNPLRASVPSAADVFSNTLRASVFSAAKCSQTHYVPVFLLLLKCSQTHYVPVFLLLLISSQTHYVPVFFLLLNVPKHITFQSFFSYRSTNIELLSAPPSEVSICSLHSFIPALIFISPYAFQRVLFIAVLSYLCSQFSSKQCLSHWLQNFRGLRVDQFDTASDQSDTISEHNCLLIYLKIYYLANIFYILRQTCSMNYI